MDNQPSGKRDGSQATLQIVDNRPDAIQLRKLQLMADNSPQSANIARLQAMADGSPYSAAQRMLMEGSSGGPIQRQGLGDEEELQMKAGALQTKLPVGPAGDVYEREAGQVDKQAVGLITRESGEPAQPDAPNRSLNARAFTTGQDTFVNQAESNPGRSGGQKLLAHELPHVVQKNGQVLTRKIDTATDLVHRDDAQVAGKVVQS